MQNWRNNSLGQSVQNSLTWEDKYAVSPTCNDDPCSCILVVTWEDKHGLG